MDKLNVVVLFGGRSTEHEVSIITGIQVLHALNKSKYNPIPIYITKRGEWVKGDQSFFEPQTFKNLEKAIEGKPRLFISPDATVNYLVSPSGVSTLLQSFAKEEIDIVFPVFHGKYGEDGSMQGLLELANIPYVGCGVAASALGMDKYLSKVVAKNANIPVLDDLVVAKIHWENDKKRVLFEINKKLKFPVFVKPARLGSTIGVKSVKSREELEDALSVAFFYDTKVLVEEAVINPREINISILGNNPYKVSACEEPIRTSDVLSFEDKYLDKKGASKGMATAKRILPAKINKDTQRKIQEYSHKFFAEIGGDGIARIDYLLSQDEKKVYFNEINTMPGSVSFYLWKETRMTFDALLDELIELGLERFREKQKLQTVFSSNILDGFSGLKAGKS